MIEVSGSDELIKKVSLIILLVILGMPSVFWGKNSIGLSDDYFQISVYEEEIPIKVDGIIRDWSVLGSEGSPVAIEKTVYGFDAPESGTDLSGAFRVCADSNYLYMLVEVNDDVLVVGEAYSGKSHWDDAVEILFSSGITVGIIVSAESNGITRTDCTVDNLFFPYMSELFGIKSVIKVVPGGYVLEASIPLVLMQLTSYNLEKGLKMAVRIWDDDDGGYQESGINWRQDKHSKKGLAYDDELYNEISFVKSKLQDPGQGSQWYGDRPKQLFKRDLPVSSSEPLVNAIQSFLNEDLETAQKELMNVGNDFRTAAMFAAMQYYNVRWSDKDPWDAIISNVTIEKTCKDRRFGEWVKEEVLDKARLRAESLGEHGFYEEAESWYLPLTHSSVIATQVNALRSLVALSFEQRDMFKVQQYVNSLLKIAPDDIVGLSTKAALEIQ